MWKIVVKDFDGYIIETFKGPYTETESNEMVNKLSAKWQDRQVKIYKILAQGYIK